MLWVIPKPECFGDFSGLLFTTIWGDLGGFPESSTKMELFILPETEKASWGPWKSISWEDEISLQKGPKTYFQWETPY